MTSKRIMSGIVSLVVLMTIAVTVGTMDSRIEGKSTSQSQPTPPHKGPDLSKYGIADYYAVESLEASDLERRKRTNQRYDGQIWVVKNPGHDTGMIGRVSEEVPPRKRRRIRYFEDFPEV